MMFTTCDSSQFRQLQSLWAKWTRIVAQAARPRWQRQPTAEQFSGVREPLLRLCSELANSTGDRDQRRMVLRMHELVEPWTSPRSVANVEETYLADLMIECRELSRELTGRDRRRRRLPGWVAPVGAIAAISGLVWLAGGLSGAGEFTLAMCHRAAGILKATSFLQRFALGTFVILSAGIFLLQKSRRF